MIWLRPNLTGHQERAVQLDSSLDLDRFFSSSARSNAKFTKLFVFTVLSPYFHPCTFAVFNLVCQLGHWPAGSLTTVTVHTCTNDAQLLPVSTLMIALMTAVHVNRSCSAIFLYVLTTTHTLVRHSKDCQTCGMLLCNHYRYFRTTRDAPG